MRAGGAALVLAAGAFVSVFLFLAATFDYPAVLDRPAAVVLPRLVALGTTGRAAWAGYALLPLLLVPGAVGVAAALGRGAAAPMRVAQLAASLSAFAMTLGLARWSTMHWTLAQAWERMPADAGARAALAATFDGLNALLGTFIGEFVGELGLYGFLLLTAAALAPHGSRGVGAGARWRGATRSLAALLAVTAAAGLVAMFRNVTAAPPREVASLATLVDGAAALSNLLLPLALAALGAWLLTVPVRGPGAAARGAGARHG
jgi:hypothetical protein